MSYERDRRASSPVRRTTNGGDRVPGKHTLTELLPSHPVQAKGKVASKLDEPPWNGTPLDSGAPGGHTIQRLFGRPAEAPHAVLPPTVRRTMERGLGADFSSVQIHVDDSAAAIGARAYTRGEHVHFAPGQYDPRTEAGQALLGHELTHVVQQREGRVRATAQAAGLPVNDEPALEREADDHGARAARGEIVRSGAPGSAPAASGGPLQGVFTVKGAPISIEVAERMTTMAGGIDTEQHEEFLAIARDPSVTRSLEEWLDDGDLAGFLLRRAEGDPAKRKCEAPRGGTDGAPAKRGRTSGGAGGGRGRASRGLSVAELVKVQRAVLMARYHELSSDDLDLLRTLCGADGDRERLISIAFELRKTHGALVTVRSLRPLRALMQKHTDDRKVITGFLEHSQELQRTSETDREGDRKAAQQRASQERRRKNFEERATRIQAEHAQRRAIEGAGELAPADLGESGESGAPRLRGGPVELGHDRDQHARAALRRQDQLFSASQAAFDRVIAEHSYPDGDGGLVTPSGGLTQQGLELMARDRPPVATAELFLLLTREHLKQGDYPIEDQVSISNKGNQSLRGEEIRGLQSYPNVRHRLTAEVPSPHAGLLLRLGRRDGVVARLRELLRGAEPSADLVTRVRRQHYLHRMEQARFPRGALSDALSMLAVELGLWDIDERYYGGSHFPMREDLATTVTGKTGWNAKEKAVLDRVYAKARLVVVDFIDAYRSGDPATRRRIEEHRIGGPILSALVRLLEVPDDEVEAATAALADATRALLRSPERSESPGDDGSRTPPRPSEEEDEDEEEEGDATRPKDYGAARHPAPTTTTTPTPTTTTTTTTITSTADPTSVPPSGYVLPTLESEQDPEIDQVFFSSVLADAVNGVATWGELIGHARTILTFYQPRVDTQLEGPCHRVIQALGRLSFVGPLTRADRETIQESIDGALSSNT